MSIKAKTWPLLSPAVSVCSFFETKNCCKKIKKKTKPNQTIKISILWNNFQIVKLSSKEVCFDACCVIFILWFCEHFVVLP